MRFWYKEHGRWMKETIQETNDICITHIIWLVLMMKNLNMQSASVQCELRLVFCFFLSWGWALIWSFCFCSTLIHVCVLCTFACTTRSPNTQYHSGIGEASTYDRKSNYYTFTHNHSKTADSLWLFVRMIRLQIATCFKGAEQDWCCAAGSMCRLFVVHMLIENVWAKRCRHGSGINEVITIYIFLVVTLTICKNHIILLNARCYSEPFNM